MGWRGWIALAGVAACTAVLVIGFLLYRERLIFVEPGVLVTIRNVDSERHLRSVTVVVTGAEYPLGDIGPGEFRAVRVNPRGESIAIVRHVRQGVAVDVRIDCYMESNYTGSLEADVTTDKVVRVKNDITI